MNRVLDPITRITHEVDETIDQRLHFPGLHPGGVGLVEHVALERRVP